MTNELLGIHHVTAMTDDAVRNYKFFTEILGMRLVKKTVNQDDIHTYHTFFADDAGNAGTDMTFFDFPGQPKGKNGTNSIYRPAFRVPSDEALMTFKDDGERLIIDHTEVSDDMRGQGVGHDLFMKVVDFARNNDRKIEATCPFAVAEIKKHEADIKDVL